MIILQGINRYMNRISYLCDVGRELCVVSRQKSSQTQTASAVYRTMNVFDRKVKCLQKERAAQNADFHLAEFIKEEVGWRTADRVFDIKRTFHNAVELGFHIQQKSLFDFWHSISCKGRITRMIVFVKEEFGNPILTEDQERELRALIKNECEKFREKWERKQRKLNLFLSHYKDWLSEDICINIIPEPTKRMSHRGRPQKSFEKVSEKTKKRKIKHLLDEYSQDQLTYAAQISVKSSGKRDAAKLIEEVSNASPRRATTYKQARKRICSERSVCSDKDRRPYTAEEALALFIANNFTVQSYKNIQNEAKERGFSLYPCYDHLARVKKECFPPVEFIQVSDTWAKVQLQALLNQIINRICKNVLGKEMMRLTTEENYTLMYKWGCDGSSGHSIYKQRFDNSESTDEYMFVISMVPLRLVTDVNNKIIWENPRPSSPRFCRVIKFIYAKETETLIKEECKQMKQQIKDLVPTIIQINEYNIQVHHCMILSMVDGKVCNVLAENRASQTCYICKATSKEMNLPTVHRQSNQEMYQFGISSLHAYIRTMECLLNIAYRLEFAEWQARGIIKQAMKKKRQKEIQKKFKQIGLIIDKVKPGFGTSNDGNTARTFFHNSSKTAEITCINEDLIKRFSTILAAIACGYEIDPEKFEEYCIQTRKLYLELYPWYNMPATVHKILVHGAEIMRHCLIPLGQMSEEASEAKNKEIRKVRLGHTLKTSRYRTNFDLIKYMLMSSDPYISLLRKLPMKKIGNHHKDLKCLLKVI